MKSLKLLQEDLYKELEKKPAAKKSSKNNTDLPDTVMAILFLILMIYGIYRGSIFILDEFSNKSLFITIILFIVMIFVVFIGSALLATICEKIFSLLTSSKSTRIRKKIISICTIEFEKEGLFSVAQIRKKSKLSELDEYLLQDILNELVENDILQKIKMNDDKILYKCLLESAKKNINNVHHDAP